MSAVCFLCEFTVGYTLHIEPGWFDSAKKMSVLQLLYFQAIFIVGSATVSAGVCVCRPLKNLYY